MAYCIRVLHHPGKRTWLVSQTAKRVYFVCALLSILFYGELISRMAMYRMGIGTPLSLTPITNLRLLFLLVASETLHVGMWYFWLQIHSDNTYSKGLWLPVLYVLSAIGSIPYFFFCYLRWPTSPTSPPAITLHSPGT